MNIPRNLSKASISRYKVNDEQVLYERPKKFHFYQISLSTLESKTSAEICNRDLSEKHLPSTHLSCKQKKTLVMQMAHKKTMLQKFHRHL